MRPSRSVPWVLAVSLLLGFGLAACAATTIRGSLHDLSAIMRNSGMEFWNTYNDYDQVCVYCHTPHNSLSGVPLIWNRSLPPSNSFNPYQSQSLISTPNTPGNYSLMCLSCHDGTIAVDAVIRMPIAGPDGRPAAWRNPAYPGQEAFHGKMANPSQSANSFADCGVACHGGGLIATDYSGTYMGQDMADDHPVTIDYPNPVTYAERFKTPDRQADGRWYNGVLLYANKVECGSCHAVHDPTYRPFLRCSNEGSALCLTCHNK